jgi:hypothetical protein
VFLDACFAGIALSSIGKWRDSGTFQATPLAALQARRSRRVITSALDDQVALDSGPVPGHSLFTGCLIEGFKQGRLGHERGLATGTEVGLYLQQRVGTYPDSRQTPDFGTFERDDRGEMVIPLLTRPFDPPATTARPPQSVSLVTATPPGTAGHTAQRKTARSRIRSIVSAGGLVSVALVSSFAGVSALMPDSDPSAPESAEAIDRQSPPTLLVSDVLVSDAAVADIDASPPNITPPPPSTPAAPSASARTRLANDRILRAVPECETTLTITPPLASTVPPPFEPAVTKRADRAPPNLGTNPATDENDCPVKGSNEVVITSFPPGATVYLNHKGCGAIGTTTQKGVRVKLRSSKGTATGFFIAILERADEPPFICRFKVDQTRRLQRVEIRMRKSTE